ncbi:MAG TPA: fluoride efflux transporter CrcB [Sphingobium sp.]|nr:fluoride efflux transporter CrcB [Sphingobium sp.]
MVHTLLVMLGGAIGAAMRYHLGRATLRLFGTGWPHGTFAANVLGGFAMGLLTGWLAMRAQSGAEQVRLFVAVGVLGGFTTFSAFSLETMLMIERGEWIPALAYAVLSVVVSVGALALGLLVMRGVPA